MRTLIAILLLAVSGGATAFANGEPPSHVTHAEVLQIAKRYSEHRWTASAQNRFQGKDADGITVHTPDISLPTSIAHAGYWQVGKVNIGIPYQWGGFDTPESFDRKIRAGFYAGDVCTAEKRKLLDRAVSRHAAGIDCSGFVSRCWKLPRSYSTRELTRLCTPIHDLSQLQPGDIFNLSNAHVLLFVGWTTANRQRIIAYETGSPLGWRVIEDEIPLAKLSQKGYTAWRYRGMSN